MIPVKPPEGGLHANVSLAPSPLAAGFVGKAVRLTPNDLADAAVRLQVPPRVIAAVLAVESSGSGFDGANRPKVLFEPHVFHRQLQGRADLLASAERAGLAYLRQGQMPYPPSSEANYARLKRACLLDPDAALKSASWGVAQVMGFNYALGGYRDVTAMVQACMDSEAAQFGLLLSYAERHGLVNAMRNRDFTTFARVYNGPGAVGAYAARLQAAYAASNPSAPVMVVSASPPAVPAPTPSGPAPVPQETADSLMEKEYLRIRSGQLATA